MLTQEQFRKIFPRCAASRVAQYLNFLNAAMRECGIVSRRRAAAFCAQVGHESMDFKYMEEIASGAAYEGRRDLGNTQPGDGRRFKGRGPIQTTGRTNYTQAARALDLPLLDEPQLLAQPQHGFRASAFWWKANKCNALADQLTGVGDARDLQRFDKITRRVNGGYNHREERQRRYVAALRVLTDEQFREAALEHTLDALTSAKTKRDATTSAERRDEPPTPPTVNDEAGTGPQPEAKSAPKEAAPDASLIDEIPIDEGTKRIAGRVATKISTRLVTPWRVLTASLMAGSVRAWIGVAICAALLGWLIYAKRAEIQRATLKILRKLK